MKAQFIVLIFFFFSVHSFKTENIVKKKNGPNSISSFSSFFSFIIQAMTGIATQLSFTHL